MKQVVAVDIGGTHARFALANLADGRVAQLHEPVVLKTAEQASFETAWTSFAASQADPLPAAAALAFAGPVGGDALHLTNSHWVIRPALLPERLGLEQFVIVNDFGAVGHAVAQSAAADLAPLTGPQDWPDTGTVTIVGPGTGLGVAHVQRPQPGPYHVVETEGGHIDFAPLDAFEDRLLQHLRARHRRVSVERVASGPALRAIYELLATIEGAPQFNGDDKALWSAALAGTDPLAVAALDRFCLILGAVAGDLALAQGAKAVVIAGGLGARLAEQLPRSGFADRFAAKGRFEALMRSIPVRLITLEQPGLFGAAAAFAARHG